MLDQVGKPNTATCRLNVVINVLPKRLHDCYREELRENEGSFQLIAYLIALEDQHNYLSGSDEGKKIITFN
jgi:hypothetical protein